MICHVVWNGMWNVCERWCINCWNGRISHGLLCEIQCEIPCEKKTVPCLTKCVKLYLKLHVKKRVKRIRLTFTWVSCTLHMLTCWYFTCMWNKHVKCVWNVVKIVWKLTGFHMVFHTAFHMFASGSEQYFRPNIMCWRCWLDLTESANIKWVIYRLQDCRMKRKKMNLILLIAVRTTTGVFI